MRPKQKNPSRYLTSATVAEILGVTKTTLKNWLRDGMISEPVRDPNNGYRLWTQHDVETIMEQRKEWTTR